MHLEMIILSEVRQRQISYVDYMWNLKKKKKKIQTNLLTKQKRTHRHRKQTYVYQSRREVGGINQEHGINRYTPLHVK